jgi:translation initiation factor 2 subunit 2
MELLSRVFQIIQAVNPEYAGDKRKYTLVPPQVAREGSKKTVFINIQDICRR